MRFVYVFATLPVTVHARDHLSPGGAIGLVIWLVVIIVAWGFIKSFFQHKGDKLPSGNQSDVSQSSSAGSTSEEKVIVTCSKCSQKLRVPANKTMEVRCSACGNRFTTKT